MKGRLQGFFEGLNISANDPTFGGYIFPTEKPFEVKQALVRPKLNNGQEWNHPDKPLPAFKTVYPHDSFKNGVPIPKPSDMLLELRGQDAIGFNLEPASLPFYPEDARVKAVAEGNQAKEYAMREQHHPAEAKEPLGFVEEASKNLQLRSKYSPETFDRLIALGFSEEDIAKAVQDEVQKDIRAVLDNPSAYTREIDTAAALESMYERWAGKRRERETGTDGAVFGSDFQNPNVYRAAGTLGENVPLPKKTGAQRMLAEMRESGKPVPFVRHGVDTPMSQMIEAQLRKQTAARPSGEYIIGGKSYGGSMSSGASMLGGGSNAAGVGGGSVSSKKRLEEIREGHKKRQAERLAAQKKFDEELMGEHLLKTYESQGRLLKKELKGAGRIETVPKVMETMIRALEKDFGKDFRGEKK